MNEPIQKFIQKNRKNLQIASDVADALPEVMAKIVDEFFDRLERRLKKELLGWKFERDKRFAFDQYPSFYFFKPDWEKQYGITLQPGDYGKDVVIGITREKDLHKTRPFSPKLLEVVKKQFKSAHVLKEWWEARMELQSPSPNWRKPDVLWRIKTDVTFVDEVADQLLLLAQISTTVIDQLVRKHKT